MTYDKNEVLAFQAILLLEKLEAEAIFEAAAYKYAA